MSDKQNLAMHTMSVLALLFIGGCTGSKPPPAAKYEAVSAAERRLASQPSKDEQRAQVQALIEQSARSASEDDRALAALAVADHATSGIVNTVRAIDTARLGCIENLSNLDTTAFKKTIVRVADGGRSVRTYVNFEQGMLESTSRPLDLGIQGQGFFKVKITDSGPIGYTRNGNLFINHTGQLIFGMGDGYSLDPPIAIPPNTTEISISQNGSVEVLSAGATDKKTVGQIKLTTFINPEGLSQKSATLFTESDDSGPAVDSIPGDNAAGLLMQGYLEGSNVELARERLRLQFLNEWRSSLLRSGGLK